jgi:hypothetical protein
MTSLVIDRDARDEETVSLREFRELVAIKLVEEEGWTKARVRVFFGLSPKSPTGIRFRAPLNPRLRLSRGISDDTSLWHLRLSGRAKDVLEHNGLETVGQFRALNRRDALPGALSLEVPKNCGERAMQELKDALLLLCGSNPGVSVSELHRDTPVRVLGLDEKSHRVLTAQVPTLGKLLRYRREDLRTMKGLNHNRILGIEQALSELGLHLVKEDASAEHGYVWCKLPTPEAVRAEKG